MYCISHHVFSPRQHLIDTYNKLSSYELTNPNPTDPLGWQLRAVQNSGLPCGPCRLRPVRWVDVVSTLTTVFPDSGTTLLSAHWPFLPPSSGGDPWHIPGLFYVRGPGEFSGIVRLAVVIALGSGPALIPAQGQASENLEFDLADATWEPDSIPSAVRPRWDWNLERVWVVNRHPKVEISLVQEERGCELWEKEGEEIIDCQGWWRGPIWLGQRVVMRSVGIVVASVSGARFWRVWSTRQRRSMLVKGSACTPGLAQEAHLWGRLLLLSKSWPPPGILGMEAPWSAASLRASRLHTEPALSWSAHPDTPSKDGWCGLAGPFYSAHFPSALLSTSFPSALLSTSPAPSPAPRPAQNISPGRKETGVQVSFSLLLLPNTALPLLLPAPSSQNRACHFVPHLS